MKRISLLLIGAVISLSIMTVSKATATDIVGKWELIRVETAEGKNKPVPSKPKMGGAEFFPNNTVSFSDGLKGTWAINKDGRIEIVLMEFLEISGTIQGNLLKLSNTVTPDEVLVLQKQQ